MELLTTSLKIYACDDAETGFDSIVSGLAETPLHFACWFDADAAPQRVHPPELELAVELVELAAHTRHPGSFPLRALSPALEARYPGADLLFLPLAPAAPGEGSGGLMIGAPAGTFGDDPAPWRILSEALGTVAARADRLRAANDECDRMRERVEEVEALDVLGLAANRTLDPDEVLGLVARFSRTLLEADYVTVSTGDSGRLRAQAAVGLRTTELQEGDDPLARSVVELGKPIYVGEDEELAASSFPLHEAEGMEAGFAVPLSLFGRTLGALVVGYRAPYSVTSRDTRLAVTLARSAAVAISNAELHRAVEARSRELEEANERLQELAGVKERFFNTMSHELRTPLNAMKGYTELLAGGVGGDLPEKARRYVSRCQAAALNLLTLVDDLLDLAKIQADRMTVASEPCALGEIVEQALASVEPQANAKGLRLSADTGCAGTIRSDAKRVRQILTNLLSNAVKFTPEGEVRLECGLVTRASAGGDGDSWMEVRVSDTGPGIDPANLELIFHEYGQVPGSDGTGLGLPISRKLAGLLGGELEVESTPGAGATFVLRLPAPAPSPAPEVSSTPPSHSAAGWTQVATASP